jgi:hypothetical protein
MVHNRRSRLSEKTTPQLNVGPERKMNTTAVHAEEIVEATLQVEDTTTGDALKELSTIELAYVGGGTYVASFV